ncbi:MAG: hypothetical protein ACYDEN_03875 [Acidimicrobiales bacterium]
MTLPASVELVPLRVLTYRMAEISNAQRVSTRGAEAVAAAEHLNATLCVWDGDAGPASMSRAERRPRTPSSPSRTGAQIRHVGGAAAI